MSSSKEVVDAFTASKNQLKALEADLSAQLAQVQAALGTSPSKYVDLARSALPLVSKVGLGAAGGGGIAALLADPGAFTGLIEAALSVFSG